MNKKGFTLVELLAVIAILAILVIIAMPNVLEMFNKAKQDAFETEVQSHVKAVTTEFITTGQLVYSNKVPGAAKLKMDGEELDYYIKLDTKGNIVVLNVTNGEYKIETTGSASNPVKAEQIGDTVKSETAQSGDSFAMGNDGTITGNSESGNNNQNNAVTKGYNQYGFYFDEPYFMSGESWGYEDQDVYVKFYADGTMKEWRNDMNTTPYNTSQCTYAQNSATCPTEYTFVNNGKTMQVPSGVSFRLIEE